MLRKTTRPYDMSIRYGGDEFVVLLSPCGRVEAEERRRAFQEAALHQARNPDGRTIPLAASAGVVCSRTTGRPTSGCSPERTADYRDKARRKDPARFDVVDMPRRRSGDWTPRYSVGS